MIKRPDSLNDTKKQTSLKDMFAKGAKPKTITAPEAPTVTEQAPKLANKSSEEVVIGHKEMQFWNNLEKTRSLIKC